MDLPDIHKLSKKLYGERDDHGHSSLPSSVELMRLLEEASSLIDKDGTEKVFKRHTSTGASQRLQQSLIEAVITASTQPDAVRLWRYRKQRQGAHWGHRLLCWQPGGRR